MLINAQTSCLLVVDIQEKLLPFVLNQKEFVANAKWLMQLASEVNVPLLVSEQYSKGLGHTVLALEPFYDKASVLDKVHFSCAADKSCLASINNLEKQQVIIIGMEVAVCVLQTALELVEQGKDVFVVVDAVSGRHHLDSELALSRMELAGVTLVSKEMVFFEWLRQAGTEQFKALSKTFIQG